VEEQHARLVRQLRALMDLSALVNSTLEGSVIRRRAVEAAARLVDAERGSLLLADRDTGELCFEVALGDSDGALKEVRLAPGQGIAGWVVDKCEGVIVCDVQSDERFFSRPDGVSDYVTRDMVCVPVVAHGRTLGALEAINKRHGAFDENDRELLSSLANQVAIAIENSNLYEELREAFYETAEALADTIEKRDPYTGGHTRRVMAFSMAIGREIGLSEEETEDLRLAAILHDIGKIGVPDEVLRKPGSLDEEEFAAMKRHSEAASEILSHVHRLRPVIPGVRSHHERVDGRGYPDGIAGDDIPLIARIIAVADTFDAMTTDRPYSRGRTIKEAVAELERCSGTQFDPVAVDAFVSAIKRGLCEDADSDATLEEGWRAAP